MSANPLLNATNSLLSQAVNTFPQLIGPTSLSLSLPFTSTTEPLVNFKNPHPINKDPEFIKLFMAEIAADPIVIYTIIALGDFEHNMHNIAMGCPNGKGNCGGCDNCYSDDTDYEMGNVKILAGVWKKAYEKWCLLTGHESVVDSDAEDDE